MLSVCEVLHLIPALDKSYAMVHTYNASTLKVEAEDQKFKGILGYKASLRSACTTLDPASKPKPHLNIATVQ